ncbi:hypothetical protein ACFRFH_01125 [Leifsonia sp. NPDC056824]|uniref:hypothetical protein n=1 Tax=Leifsonia sp. NPDC056824 TaxID=3345953 RepID=UPI003685C980
MHPLDVRPGGIPCADYSIVGLERHLSPKHLPEGSRPPRPRDPADDAQARITVGGRISGSGYLAVRLVLPLWLIALALVLAVPPTSFTPFDAVARVLWIVASVWFVVRSLIVGVYVRNERLVIVGWFWIHRIARSEIDDFVTKPYDGLMTRGDDRNVFSSRVRSLGVDVAFERVRYFDSIALPNRVSSRVVAGLQRIALVASEEPTATK